MLCFCFINVLDPHYPLTMSYGVSHEQTIFCWSWNSFDYIAWVISVSVFSSSLFWLVWNGPGSLDKEDITYFCEPTRVREHLNPNVTAVGRLFANVARSRWIKSDQTTPPQSWGSKITGFWGVEYIITLRLLISPWSIQSLIYLTLHRMLQRDIHTLENNSSDAPQFQLWDNAK